MKIKGCGKPKGNKKVKLFNCNNIDLMKHLPDEYFDLAVCDPPYGIDTTNDAMGGREINKEDRKLEMTWDKELPPYEYYEEVMRVSKDWLFWGANWMPILWSLPRKNVVVWDKKIRGLDFADCEIAVSSIDDGARIYDRSANDKKRIHANQKPVKLYAWLLERYAEQSFKVFDPNLGSGSSAIAAHFFGCEFIGCESEKVYFKRLTKRFKKDTQQQQLFEGFGV